MRDRVYRCYAYGTAGHWQGICVDLDISVQGTSFRDIFELLGEAISTYVEDASQEEPDVAQRLLDRRAPWGVRLKLAVSSALHILRVGRDAGMTANFDVPCHA
jgi:hypothetical protein